MVASPTGGAAAAGAAPPAAGGTNSGRVCIASTVLHSICFTEWLDYHIALGVAHFYLYFDSPDDPNRAVAREYGAERVSVRESQAPGRPITAKQCANVRHAIAAAGASGEEGWLLHIDDDELLHLGDGVTLRQLFSSVPRDTYDLHFRNLEVCKTVGQLDGYDFFSDEEYFYTKVRRSYRNGKSAAAIRFADKGLGPNGAHFFVLRARRKTKPSAEEAAGDGTGKRDEEVDDGDDEGGRAEGLFLPPRPRDPPVGMTRVARDAACVLHYPFVVYPRWRSKCSREDLSEWKVNWGFYRSSKSLITAWDDGEEALKAEFLRRCVLVEPKLSQMVGEGEVVRLQSARALVRRGRAARSAGA